MIIYALQNVRGITLEFLPTTNKTLVSTYFNKEDRATPVLTLTMQIISCAKITPFQCKVISLDSHDIFSCWEVYYFACQYNASISIRQLCDKGHAPCDHYKKNITQHPS